MVARWQRAQLCDLFEYLGPDAPTLCEGWVTRDVAAHLWVREHRPWAVPGMVATDGVLHRSTDRLQARVAQRPYKEIVASLHLRQTENWVWASDLKDIVDGQSQTDPRFRTDRLYTRLSAAGPRRQLIS